MGLSYTDFMNEVGPYAQQAGNTLGVQPGVIMGQWALETGYGNSMSGTNNFGNILSHGTAVNYASPEAFEQNYVSTIQNNYPNAVNTGANEVDFFDGLKNGKIGSYFGSESADDYGNAAKGAADNLFRANQDLFSQYDTTAYPLPIPASGDGTNALSNILGSDSSGGIPGLSSGSGGLGLNGSTGGLMSLLGGSGSGGSGSILGSTGAGGGMGGSGSSSGSFAAFLTEVFERGALITFGLVLVIGAFYLLGQRSGSGSSTHIIPVPV